MKFSKVLREREGVGGEGGGRRRRKIWACNIAANTNSARDGSIAYFYRRFNPRLCHVLGAGVLFVAAALQHLWIRSRLIEKNLPRYIWRDRKTRFNANYESEFRRLVGWSRLIRMWNTITNTCRVRNAIVSGSSVCVTPLGNNFCWKSKKRSRHEIFF